MKILSFDPSGNYHEGKGTSGYCISNDYDGSTKLGDIKASDFPIRQAYWAAHRDLIEQNLPDVIVIESYKLFGHKSKEQAGSSLETPQLIGYLEMVAYDWNIPVFFQDPSTKQRHSDDILVRTGVLKKNGKNHTFNGKSTNLHQRDALRHDMYFRKFNQGKVFK